MAHHRMFRFVAALLGAAVVLAACSAQRQAPTAPPADQPPTPTAGAESAPAPSATPGAGSLSALATELAGAYIAKRPQAGVVVGILHGGQRWVQGFGGVAGAGSAAPDGASIYEIGSITKVFTGILLARMAEDGRVGLDDPIA